MEIRTELKLNQIFQELGIDKNSQDCVKSFYEDIISEKDKEIEDIEEEIEFAKDDSRDWEDMYNELTRETKKLEDEVDILNDKIKEYESKENI